MKMHPTAFAKRTFCPCADSTNFAAASWISANSRTTRSEENQICHHDAIHEHNFLGASQPASSGQRTESGIRRLGYTAHGESHGARANAPLLVGGVVVVVSNQ